MSYNKRWVLTLGLVAAMVASLVIGAPGGLSVVYGQASQCPDGGASNSCSCSSSNSIASTNGQGCSGSSCLGGGSTANSSPSNYPNVSGSSSAAVGALATCGCDSSAAYNAIDNYFLNNPSNAQGVGSVLAGAGVNCNANFQVVGNAALTAFLSTGATSGAGLDAGTAQALVTGLNNNGVSDSDILATISNNGGSTELSAFLSLFPCSDPIWTAAASYGLTCSGAS